jgi:hypothetical protein
VQVVEDRDDLGREQARAGADLHHRVAPGRRDGLDDAAQVMPVGKKVLAEALAGARQHGRGR